jgi:hypothetical protein
MIDIMWLNSKVFAQLVQNHFSYLEKYDMHFIEGKIEECVRFESNSTWLEIWFDKYSLFIKMGLKKESYEISLWDIMEYACKKGKDVLYMASSEEKLKKGLQKLSDYVKLYCDEALSGNIDFYKKILISKKIKGNEDSVKHMNLNVEKRAKTAWLDGNYDEVIRLYQIIKDDLTPIQKRRLQLAKKNLQSKS